MYNTLGRLRRASYKGIEIFVNDSAIIFGQKAATHQYPNANRTEVEYLGIADDKFVLEIFVHGAGLIEKRRRLKEALSEGKDGKLVHPFEGDVNVAVSEQPTVIDNFRELGLTKFTVTFQKVDEQAYPSESTGWSLANIAGGINDVIDAVDERLDAITMVFSPNAIANKTGLTELMDSFDNAMRFTYKLADKATELNEGILDFKRKINTYAYTPTLLKTAFTNLFTTIDFVAQNNKDQIGVLKQFYDFGSQNRVITEDTLERTERAKNQDILTNAVLANSIVLSYGTAVVIDYGNQEELAIVRNAIEDQYDAIKEDLSNSIRLLIEIVRSSALGYLEGLDIAGIREIQTHPTSLTLLGFSIYGNLSKYDALFRLNKTPDPAFVSGTVKVFDDF